MDSHDKAGTGGKQKPRRSRLAVTLLIVVIVLVASYLWWLYQGIVETT